MLIYRNTFLSENILNRTVMGLVSRIIISRLNLNPVLFYYRK